MEWDVFIGRFAGIAVRSARFSIGNAAGLAWCDRYPQNLKVKWQEIRDSKAEARLVAGAGNRFMGLMRLCCRATI